METFAIILFIIIIVFVFWRFVYFFRNPDRKINYNDNHILSPADGFVVYVKRVEPRSEIFSIKKGDRILLDDLMFIDDSTLLDKPGWLIGICMSPLDIHFNRSPLRGTIAKIRHDYPTKERKNKDMFPGLQNLFFNIKPYYKDCDYIIRNERASYIIKNEILSVYVTQIADNWIKKIVTYKDKTEVSQGEVFGLIRMGSQVDLFIPDDKDMIKVVVEERKHVKAGITILGTIQNPF